MPRKKPTPTTAEPKVRKPRARKAAAPPPVPENDIPEAECRSSGAHLTRVDKDGYCVYCGSQEPVVDPKEEWVELYTTAPQVYDGFSTTTLKVVGVDRRGRDVRRIKVRRRDYDWQTQRYGSGLCAFTSERCTLEGFVRLGDWTLNLIELDAEGRAGPPPNYAYRYEDSEGRPLRLCPACGDDLTIKGAVAVECSSGNGTTWRQPDRLDDAGNLTDGGGAVASGNHGRTLCATCDEQLMDSAVEVGTGLCNSEPVSEEDGERFLGILKLSADEPGRLRGCDVDRVMRAALEAGCLAAFRAWLYPQAVGETRALVASWREEGATGTP